MVLTIIALVLGYLFVGVIVVTIDGRRIPGSQRSDCRRSTGDKGFEVCIWPFTVFIIWLFTYLFRAIGWFATQFAKFFSP